MVLVNEDILLTYALCDVLTSHKLLRLSENIFDV